MKRVAQKDVEEREGQRENGEEEKVGEREMDKSTKRIMQQDRLQ